MLFKRLFLSYFVIIFIPLFILALTVSSITSKTISEDISNAAEQTLEQTANNISNIFNQARNTALLISMNDAIQFNLSKSSSPDNPFEIDKDIQAINNAILYFGILSQNYTSIEVYAMNKPGYPYMLKENAVMSGEIVKDKEWYKETLRLGGKFYWHITNDFGTQKITLSRMVINSRGSREPIAVVSIDTDFSKLNSILSDITLGKNGSVYVVDGNGNIVASNSDKPLITKTVLDNKGTGIHYLNINNTGYMVTYNTLALTNWTLIGLVPTNELMKKPETLTRTIFIITFVSLIIALLISIYFSRRISRPIIHLAKTMQKVEKGDLNLSVETNMDGEIEILYDSFNYMIKRINSLINEAYVSQIKEKDAELKALQAQIDPHFLYNTLDSINWLAIRYNVRDISKMVTSLASLLRYSINKGEKYITVEHEINQVKSYLNIQQIRYKDRFSVDFNVNEGILQYKIIKLILQPLVENAIIHGIETYSGKGHIEIQGLEEEGQIIFKVISMGNLVNLDKVNKLLNAENDNKSHGIQNVNQRLQLTYGKDYGLKFEVIDDKTVATLNIPISSGGEKDV